MRRFLAVICVLAALASFSSCASGDSGEATFPEETRITEPQWAPVQIGVYQAEEGTPEGTVVEDGCVTGFDQDGDSCTVTVSVPEDGFYDLKFSLKPLGGYKENYVFVDGEKVGFVACDGSKYVECPLHRIFLTAGEHAVTLTKYWGHVQWDRVTVWTSEPFDETVFEVSPQLVNPNATENARRLFSYLCDTYGKAILSGQYCDTGMNGWEIMKMAEVNGGKYPAILGLDVGYYSQTGVDHGADISTTEQALACWEKGGIVTLCWHWLAPEKYIDGTWYSAFRPEHTNINLTKIMNGQDPEGMELIRKDIDNIARQLLIMQEAGVPVLWRPLHEASGGWFWWGAEGPDAYKQLYILLYDTLTQEYGLNNLIWVWNGQNAAWYPGDEYVDIIGIDIYAGEHVYSSQIDQFLLNQSYARGNKLVALSENGTLVDPELALRDRAMWSYFCTWSGEFVMTDGLRKAYSEQYTDKEMLTKVYNSPYVITRDELPDLKTYPIRDDGL